MAVLGPRFCARAFSSCGKRGPPLTAVCGPLTIAASPVAEHRLQTRRLSNCGSRAQLLRGMWDPPRPGLEPVSPALAGRFPTTAPPGKPTHLSFNGAHNGEMELLLFLLTAGISSTCFTVFVASSKSMEWFWIFLFVTFVLLLLRKRHFIWRVLLEDWTNYIISQDPF